jgi:hypothetical protein
MTKISIAFLAALSLAGSGCHKPQRGADKSGAVAKLTELKDRMCACKAKTCSDQVSDEYSRWNQEQSKSDRVESATPSEQDKRMEELTEELTRCLLKLEVPSGGSAGAGAAGSAGSDGSAGGSSAGGSSAAAGSAQ